LTESEYQKDWLKKYYEQPRFNGKRIRRQLSNVEKCIEAKLKPEPEKCMACEAYLRCPLVLEEAKKT
jgi:hypothetical protein